MDFGAGTHKACCYFRMTKFLRGLGLVVTCGCASGTGSERPASPTPLMPANSAVAGLGYNDAVKLGADFAHSRGHQLNLLGVHQEGLIWHVRYRKAAGEPGDIHLQFDAKTGELVHMDEHLPGMSPHGEPDGGR